MRRSGTMKLIMRTSFKLGLFFLLMIATTSVVKAEDLTADVIIIGAGICGITAGRTLAEKGVTNILILEATDRIGGRMRIKEFAGINIELGANWVEGVNGDGQVNPIWTLANQIKLRSVYSLLTNMTNNLYDVTGALPPQNQAGNFTANENAYVSDLGTTLSDNNEPDISVLTAQRLYGGVPSTPVQMALEYDLYDGEFAVRATRSKPQSVAAEPPRVTSLKNTWPTPTFSVFGPDTYFVADQRGYVAVLGPIADAYLKTENGTITDARLKFFKVVNKIQYTDTGVKVFTEDGSTYSAKTAIVTVSIGVLQSTQISFEPVLPYWKIEALYEFDMAIYTKIFLKFPKRFWRTGPGTEFFLYADDSRGYYTIWQHLDNEYPEEHIIFVTVTDLESKRIEQQSDNKTQAEIMEVLRSMFGPDIPEPEAILVPKWWSNRFFRGTYSNWPIGVTQSHFDDIQAPVGRVYFSGEATSYLFSGYVHGAYLQGIETGKRVASCLQRNVCPSGSTKKKTNKPNEKHFMETTCAGPIKEELDLQRQHWAQRYSTLEDVLSSKCSRP